MLGADGTYRSFKGPKTIQGMSLVLLDPDDGVGRLVWTTIPNI